MRGRTILVLAAVGVVLSMALIALAATNGARRATAPDHVHDDGIVDGGTSSARRVAAVQPRTDAGPADHADHGAVPPPARPAQGGVREEARAAVDVVPEQQSRIGLQTRHVARERVSHTIRAVGSVVADERREATVNTRVAGWIDEISVSAVGVPVKRGQVLYRLYAPEIVATQHEIVAARGQGDLGKKLLDAAFERLALWDVAPFEIAALREGGAPKRSLAFVSPMTGFVIEKTAVKGIYVTPDVELYRIADLSRVWVIVSLFENEIPLVSVGDEADVALTTAPSESRRAKITYVYPELDVATRTGRARIEIENPQGDFKPGMFANVVIEKDLGEALVVPEDAIIFTGARNLVFKKTAPTRFVPVEVNVGPRTKGGRVILSGVSAGDEVVVRATFLLDAESRLRAALERGGKAGGHGGHGG